VVKTLSIISNIQLNYTPSNKNNIIHGLYAITDPDLLTEKNIIFSVKEAIRGGAKIIQYRNKSATTSQQYAQANQLSHLCKQYNVIFIVNDDPQLAKAVSADGVHVGKEDGKIIYARQYLGPQTIIGVSCYNQLENAHKAIAQGADYVAFGRFFPSKTKPEAVHADIKILNQASRELAVPIVAIGGITLNNATALISQGTNAVAVINDLFHNTDEIYNTAKAYRALFLQNQLYP
jgi:thiamine-phosphate pyrophosphorylase